MLECVANVSEGRDEDVLAVLAAACGPSLLDVHTDRDHHRSVFTLAGPGALDAEAAVRSLAAEVARRVHIGSHSGVHPRFGALDVVPFVALEGTTTAAAHDAAHRFARWWVERYGVPVFFYDDADPLGRDLPHARRHAFADRSPDLGPPRPHPALGATAIGARAPLVAVNCVLTTSDMATARRVARAVRGRDGGLAGVRALAFELSGPGRAQVSMNVCDLHRTSVEQACAAVRSEARAAGTDVAGVELVGLLPRRALERCSAGFLEWSGIDETHTIEHRLAARRTDR